MRFALCFDQVCLSCKRNVQIDYRPCFALHYIERPVQPCDQRPHDSCPQISFLGPVAVVRNAIPVILDGDTQQRVRQNFYANTDCSFIPAFECMLK